MKTIPLNKSDVNIVDAKIIEDEADYMKIKTFSDANNGYESSNVESPNEKAYRELKIIIKAINNNDNFPDWDDTFQQKWHPVFITFPTFKLVDSVKHDAPYVTTVGNFFIFESKEKSDYVATQFIEHYKSLMTI
jgi:hypothetical protein